MKIYLLFKCLYLHTNELHEDNCMPFKISSTMIKAMFVDACGCLWMER